LTPSPLLTGFSVLLLGVGIDIVWNHTFSKDTSNYTGCDYKKLTNWFAE